MISWLSFITLGVVLLGLTGRVGYGRALALGGATVAGSAIVVAGTAVPTFYAVAIGAAVAVTLRAMTKGTDGRWESLPPGVALLVLFFAWSTFVTLAAPFFFDGAAIVTPVATHLTGGVVTSSNLAQIAYLFLGVCVVLFLARSPRTRPGLIGLAAGTCTLLSFWRYLGQTFGLPFPEGLFDNSPSFVYIQTAAGGLERFRGILSEPSSLAGTSLVTIAYLVPRAMQVRGGRRVAALAVAAVALYLGIISTSATFVVAGLVSGAVMAVTGVTGFLLQRSSLSRALSLVGITGLLAAPFVVPAIAAFVNSTVNGKLTSSSYTDRTSANSDSLRVFLDSYGFGVGLGSARASSFLPTLISATGLIGTVLFVAAVGTLIYRGAASREYRPVVWALMTLLVTKVIAGPDLSDNSGVLWISLGLLSHVAMQQRTVAPVDHPSPAGDSPGEMPAVPPTTIAPTPG